MTSMAPHEHERDWDAEFAEITGRLDGLATGSAALTSPTNANRSHFDAPPSKGSDSLDGGAATLERSSAEISPAHRPPGEPVPHVTLSTRSELAADPEAADETAFSPAPPRPLEADDPATVIMIAGLVGGPLWLVYLTVFDRAAGSFWWLLAALATVVGLALAIARQPKSREEDDDDDGARV